MNVFYYHSKLSKAFTVTLVLTTFLCCKPKATQKTQRVIPEVKEKLINTKNDITSDDILTHIKFLASDSLKGRLGGSEYEKEAGNYISSYYKQLKLKKCFKDYTQEFSFTNGVKYYKKALVTHNFEGVINKNYRHVLTVDSIDTNRPIAFVGYGYNYTRKGKTVKHYSEEDVKNKWAMIFSKNILKKRYSRQDLLKRYRKLEKAGAAGVLVVTNDKRSEGKRLPSRNISYFTKNIKIPMIEISKEFADSILAKANTSTFKVFDKITKSRKFKPIPINCNLKCMAYSKPDTINSQNIVATLKGRDSVLCNEYIVVGAHYDHLGEYARDNRYGGKKVIYNGADDNASGTAGILELAEKLSTSNIQLKRSIIFAAFGSEELGIKGSAHFVKNLPVPKDKIKLMINLDMIGRMDSCNTLYYNTVVKNANLENKINKLKRKYSKINLTDKRSKRIRSDYRDFHKSGIPVVAFNTGKHKQFHRPTDDVELINAEGEEKILNFVHDLIVLQADTIKMSPNNFKIQ